MDKAAEELQSRIAAVLDGRASDDEAVQLSQLLRDDPAARDAWLFQADLHARLAVDETFWTTSEASAQDRSDRAEVAVAAPVHERSRFGRKAAWGWSLAAAGLLAISAWNLAPRTAPAEAPVARFTRLDECRWVASDANVQPGDGLLSGQRVELSSGKAEILFASGAAVTLVGPAIFETLSANSARLVIGQLKAVAQTPASKGFTVQTRTAKLVDIGTEFVATASADGYSRVDVSVGEVDVQLDGVASLQRLFAGDALGVEPGERRVVSRIERGDDTPNFRFPTIEPPSSTDAADASAPGLERPMLRAVFGSLSKHSGPVEGLLDGRGQEAKDTPEQSVFFNDEETGMLLLDLKRVVDVRKVNSYSWHGNVFRDRVRATQRFSLYGFRGDEPPPVVGPLLESGWERIARVDTEEYFRTSPVVRRPAQQASSITAAGGGSVGRYRYLLWHVIPSVEPTTKRINGTLFGEFDVYAYPDDVPAAKPGR